MSPGKRKMLRPERRPGELWESYKARRAAGNEYIKRARRGRLAWSNKAGTYRKAVHGALA